MIEIRQIGKRFGEVQALVEVSFSLAKGAALALVGPSGSGKTTLLRLICGLEEPDSGEIAIEGRVVSRPGLLAPPWERGIGAVFQKPALWPHLSAWQNAAYGLAGWKKPEAQGRIRELFQALHLEKLARRLPHQLSGGEAQRVALARALAPRPKILLLDEPFSNLDPDLRAELLALVQQVCRDENMTLILVAHDLEIAATCEQRLALRAGRVVEG